MVKGSNWNINQTVKHHNFEIFAGTELETNFDFEPLVQHKGLDGDVKPNPTCKCNSSFQNLLLEWNVECIDI